MLYKPQLLFKQYQNYIIILFLYYYMYCFIVLEKKINLIWYDISSNNSFSALLKKTPKLGWPVGGFQDDLDRNAAMVLKFSEGSFSKCHFILICRQNLSKSFLNGCAHYIFASLFCMSKREYYQNKEKCFLFHFENSSRSWDNQLLTF